MAQVEKLVVGQNKILHLNARPDNLPTAIPVKADQDLVRVEQFLVTQNKQRGDVHYHFSLIPQFKGKTAMVLQYANGDVLQIVFEIEEAQKVAITGSRDERIEEAKKALRAADDFWANRTSARATLRNAYLKYEEALRIMGSVELGQNLDEYKQAKAGMELARSEIEGQRVEIEKKFGQSERREDWAGAQQLLEEMLELRLGNNDLIYLKNKTIMEYRYGRTVTE
ncbi:MAG: hypothetical protein HY720_22120 [Planctomycetes bacterium]|nr:hypothetical protein [Planctomycetota bacterium]